MDIEAAPDALNIIYWNKFILVLLKKRNIFVLEEKKIILTILI